jgi:hypothetical protein
MLALIDFGFSVGTVASKTPAPVFFNTIKFSEQELAGF